MRTLFVTICFIFIPTFAMLSAFGQAEMSRWQKPELPEFHFDAVNVVSPTDPEISRLNIFLKIAYDELQFIKKDDKFIAKYEITAVLLDNKGDQIDGKIWEQSILVNNFEQTNDFNRFDLANVALNVPPGDYNLSLSVLDTETGISASKKEKMKLRDFSVSNLSISEIAFVSNIQIDSLGIKSICPEVTDDTRSVTGNLFAYFEIYSLLPGDTVRVEYQVLDLEGKSKIGNQYVRKKTGFRTLDYIPVPLDSLGKYIYNFKIKVSEENESDQTEKLFNHRWTNLPSSAQDIDEAIEQLRYIATRKEWKKFQDGKEEEMQSLFEEYWESHDPTPGTPVNEAMDEYYNRVGFANNNFKAMNREGWRTDMGMVYIILGQPDDIEREAYPRGSKPYQIWYYYRINRNFVFVDRVGFGEYRLETPLSIYDIQRGRY